MDQITEIYNKLNKDDIKFSGSCIYIIYAP